ncbi:hypothetical protein BDY17DRAFT_312886 [Neohortaea acidophila]|uniref:Uncharacterized protein n=1 Tax=Neohortaea acidophila TaxID=245834 RepID=A0A6A6PIV3_9PEZI|nr:uncharacterized protein BDY17DRAFT_312886 [Neohortaea acidophila]KAF2479978.1 hypothetical protein BDY17DRAFT_312886 [Neohortaea acidophila]
MGDIGAEQETASALNLNAPASPLPTAVPNVVAHLRSETPAKRSTSNKENIEPQDVRTPQPSTYDALETAAVTAATPPPAPAADPITALDALDEAVESVKYDIPDVQSSPEKPKRTSESTERKVVKKAAPVVRATKASQARISLAQNPEAASRPPALGRPRPSTTLARSASVRQSSAGTIQSGVKPSPPAVVAKREVIIPHSKPRPVSLSFPTPPQPMKSTKAPTQSTFQLPGEAVAAKLKAAKEARQQKELDEAGQKKAFKARPVPASLSRAPSVRHTNASKARESLMSGKDLRASTAAATTPGAVAAHRRAQSVATALNPRVSVSHSTLSASRLGTSTASSKPSAGRLSTASTASTAHRPRPSLAPASSFNPTASTQRPTTTTAKGKEVFNRPAAAKAAAEKAKFDKEAAAKKARAEAAERGRAASREWAEKQKRLAAAKKEAMESAKAGGEASVGVVL